MLTFLKSLKENIFLLKRYFRYFLNARHYMGHGIHSPFLYSLAEKVIYKKDNKKKYVLINDYVSQLKKSKDKTEILDKGAGTRLINTKSRKIASIARYGITQKKYGQLIARLTEHLQPHVSIELGTSLGVGTLYLTSGTMRNRKIYTIEADQDLIERASQKFKDLGLNHVIPLHGEFDEKLPELLEKIETFDLAYIDGNHRKEPTLRYFNWLLEKHNTNTVLIFDDIHWSKEMEEAWAIIISNPNVKLSLDLFQLGLVFFRTGLSKEHYIIRY